MAAGEKEVLLSSWELAARLNVAGILAPTLDLVRTLARRSLAFQGTSRNNVAVNPTGTLPPYAAKFLDSHKFSKRAKRRSEANGRFEGLRLQ